MTADSLINTVVGPYRVQALLGEGGFGAVYMAEQELPVRRRVALKVLRPGRGSREILARFEAERQILALLDHPSVAKVYDAGESESGFQYLVMELVRGEPITAFCTHERLSLDDRVRLMIQVCEAVQHAHMKGVIHRDLKPGNILVALVDGRPLAKVIDFGVAKILNTTMTSARLLTEIGQVIGTLEYMSPEQARGSPVDVDTRADVYALGAILYELLTGKTPLDPERLRVEGYAAALRSIEEEQPLRPSERVTRALAAAEAPAAEQQRKGDSASLSRDLRGDLDWITMRCLEKERARRYDSAGALARDLARYLADEPVEAGPPSTGYRAMKFVRRHRAGVLAAGLVAATLLAAVAVTGWGLSQAVRERALAQSHAAEAEAVTEFLSGMLAAADPESSGRDTLVRDVLDRASQSIGSQLQEQPEVEARLRQTIGNAYRGLGLLEPAEQHLEAALEILMRELGDRNPRTVRVLGNLAGLRFQQGRFAESERLSRSALEGFCLAGKTEDPDVLGVMNNLAQACLRQGRLGEAAELQADVLEGQRRVQGPDHPHALGAMVNLAAIYESLGRMSEAEALLLQAVDGWQRAHGAEHPGTLLAMGNLAGLYMQLGRPADAESLYRRELEVSTRVLGREHPSTIGALSNLGYALSRQGSAAEAEAYFVEAWDLSRRVLGEDHPSTLTAALNLTTIYEAQGWPAAMGGRIAGLVLTLRTVAARPHAAAKTLNDFAWLLLVVEPEALRDPDTALRAAIRACDQERASGGIDLWKYLDTLALAQYRTGDPGAAVASQREALELLPPTGAVFRAEMQDRLGQYERAPRPDIPRR